MGDADWLRETGLNWGWDDCYPDFRERKSKAERWISRNPSKRLMSENDEAMSIAAKLVNLKQQIHQLECEERDLKKKLEEILPIMSWIKVDFDGVDNGPHIVEHLSHFRKPVLNTKKALRVIKRKYGEDAARLIAEECSVKAKKVTAIYVRLNFLDTYFDESEEAL